MIWQLVQIVQISSCNSTTQFLTYWLTMAKEKPESSFVVVSVILIKITHFKEFLYIEVFH